MKDLAELERRITAALARIGAGIDQVQPTAGQPEDTPETAESDRAERAQLRAALEAEREVSAELRAALALAPQPASAEGIAEHTAALQARIEELTRQVDVQGLELQRMRHSMIQLRETLRALREQASDGVEAHLINRAMLAELEALRAARSSEVAELGALLAELAPLVETGADEERMGATDA